MDLRTLLEKTKLFSAFPGHLKRQDLFAIVKPLDHSSVSNEESLRSLFINLITHFNGECRNLVENYNRYRPGLRAGKLASKSKEQISSSHVHPLDISTAVFLCCNPVARQDLVFHYWGCRHAFPFVVQVDRCSSPELYFWPMQAILENNGQYDSFEQPITQYNVKIISILRFNKLEESKSLIFNKILARSEKVHSFFFHHDCEGSVPKKSSVCKGLIEAAPLFRSETGPALYLNLRGNAEKYRVQRQFLCSISNIIIIVCKTHDLKKIQQIANTCHDDKFCEVLIILFTDLGTDRDSVSKYSDLDSFSSGLPIETHMIPLRKMLSSDMVRQISCTIDSLSGVVKFTDILDIATKLEMIVDEHVIETKLKKAKKVSSQILNEYLEHGKMGIFPAQGKNYIEWAKNDREIYKLQKWNRTENVQKYRGSLEKLKRECRRKQYEAICVSESKSVVALVNIISGKYTTNEAEIIIRSLSIALENATRTNISKIYSDFKHLFNQIKLNETNEAVLCKVADLDGRMNQSAFNISDIVSEMGQMYEAIDAMNRTSMAVTSNIFRKGVEKLHLDHMKHQLPETAIQLLLLGYPLELMDGRSNSVPILWIQRVFLELQNYLGNVSIKIVSVLGTQSTGKSTLLNVMFGSQFTIGPGRCTRGLYMQLAKVSDEMKPLCSSDYFLIIDTEGLYSSYISPEQIDERDNTERELATFVIGLSNVTIVNIMGENMSYLKDILPITVHAFLRMDLVGLRPKCRLLHHNVDRRNEMSLLEQSKSLQTALDEYTEAACKLEQERVRRFGDIIHFDITKSIDYFPPPFDSDLVRCISSAYSHETMKLKNTLTTDKSFFTLDEARHHIAYLWNAIKLDNFVYEFRNTIETEAQSELDKHACRAEWNVRQNVQNVQNQFEAEIENCNESNQVEAIGCRYEENVVKLITDGVTEYSHVIDNTNMPNLLAQAIQKFKFASINTLETAVNEYKQTCFAFFKRTIERKISEMDVLHGNRFVFLQLDHFLQKELKSEQISHLKDSTAEKRLFGLWMKQMFTKKENIAPHDYEEHAAKAVYRYFPMHRAKVDKVLCKRHIRDYCMQTFSISDHYWPKHMQWCVKEEQKYVEKIFQDIILHVKTYANGIKSRSKFYQEDIFSDLVLRLRNHFLKNRSKLHSKPSIEIDLAVSLCGELIQNLENMEIDGIVISNTFKKLAKQHFILKLREAAGFHTSVNEVVENITETLLHKTEKYLLKNIANHLAAYFKEDFPYLRSKHGLLCYVFTQLLDNEDCLLFYLRSPEFGTQCCLSALYDSNIGIASTSKNRKLHQFLEKLVHSTLQTVINKLVNGIENNEKCLSNSQANVMEKCINIIISSLGSIMPVNDIRKFQEDIIEEIDPCVVLQKLVAKLKENNATAKIVKSLKYSVLENLNDDIRYKTVLIILESLVGCKEKCPCCGEICCIGQAGHPERHKTIMHRPTGFRKILKESAIHSATVTCWDEVNSATAEKGQCSTSVDTLMERWLIPVDVEIESNSFWKYVFATHITDFATKQHVEGTVEIPDSWKTLTKAEEFRKLKEMLERITKQ